MGACKVSTVRSGFSASEVYSKIQQECEYEFGNDHYNGTFSTCDSLHMLGSENHAPYKKTTEKALLKKYRERLEACPKWEAYVIDLGVEKYILYEVKRKATKKTPPKYKTKFVVYTGDSRYPGEDRYIKAFNSKAEADTFAKKEMLKNPLVLLHVNKERTLVGGTETVTDFQIIRREYKSRPHPKSMDGKVLKELHRYYFEGCAAE